ncbi:MAG: YihY/virulence factor BrkB family protein [Crocinitomicaceae bacterium]|nr:YihY/virulence factor BrkB family protein [Crocinitomicaceae bacterium]
MPIRKLTYKEIYQVLKDSISEFLDSDSFSHCAAFAYYALFAFIPIIFLAINIFGFFVGNEDVAFEVKNLLINQLGEKHTELVNHLVNGAAGLSLSYGSQFVGLFVFLFSSSALLYALKKGINAVWGIKVNTRKKVIKTIFDRVVSLFILFLIGLVFVAFMFIETLSFSIIDLIQNHYGFHSVIITFLLKYFMGFVISVVTIFILFKILPDATTHWKLILGGAVVTAILGLIGKYLIGWYIGNINYISQVGFGGSIMVILLWVFYNGMIILLGAKFTAVYARKVGYPISFSKSFVEFFKVKEAN